jgi:hypothetical protein
MVPRFGVGVEWMRAVAPGGVAALVAFMESHLGLTIPEETINALPGSLRNGEVFWDFKMECIRALEKKRPKTEMKKVSMFGVTIREDILEQLGDVEIVHSEAPKQKRANLSKPSVAGRASSTEDEATDQAQALKMWMTLVGRRKRVDEPAKVIHNGKKRKATILSVDAQAMFLEYKKKVPEVDDRLLVEAGFSIEKNRYQIRFIVKVKKVLFREDKKLWGVETRILSVTEGGFRGVFTQYLKS